MVGKAGRIGRIQADIFLINRLQGYGNTVLAMLYRYCRPSKNNIDGEVWQKRFL